MDPVSLAGAVATVAAGLTGVTWMVRGAWRLTRSVHRLADAILGDRSAVPPRLGLVERVGQIEERLIKIDVKVGG